MNISRPQWKRYANTTTNRQNKTINRKALRRIDHTIQRTANYSINRFWLSTTATLDRDGCSPTICTPFRKRHRMFTAWPHLTGAPHDFQLTHALLQRKNPCLCSGEHVWKDTTWSCRTLVVPGRPWEKPPFFQPISRLSTNTGLTQGRQTSEWLCWFLANVWKRTGRSPAGGRRASPPKRLPVAIRESRGSLAGQSTRLSLRRWQACCLALIAPPDQSNSRQQHFPNKH